MATKKKKKTVVKKKKAVKKAPAPKKKKLVKKGAKKAIKKATKKPIGKKQAGKKPALKKAALKATQKTKTASAATAVKAAPAVDYGKAVTPLGDRLVVRVESAEKLTAGGLIIPDTSSLTTGYLKARVLAVGVGGRNKKGQLRPLDVQVGDQVLFSEQAGTKIQFNSEELQIIHEADVMGILQNSK
jgi:chaperonin GroES